jgi:hypothetical protein
MATAGGSARLTTANHSLDFEKALFWPNVVAMPTYIADNTIVIYANTVTAIQLNRRAKKEEYV